MITTTEALKLELDSVQLELANAIKRIATLESRGREYEARVRDLTEQLTSTLLREQDLRETNEAMTRDLERMQAGVVRVRVEGVVT
jgi:chromosome segregation ATPase